MSREAERLGKVLHLVNDLQEDLQEKMDIDKEKMETLNDLEKVIKERITQLENKDGCQ